MLDKIQDYEKRLLDDRQRLLMLIQEYGEGSPELLQSRLEYFETELQYMNRQLEWLKKQQISRVSEASMVTADGQVPPMNPTVQGSYQQTPPVNPTVQSSYQQIPPVNPQVQSSYQQIPPVNPQVQSSYQQIPPVNPQVQSGYQQVPPVMQGRKDAGSGKKDLEQVIGKSLMGIFASVLIFISLILFSTLVLRELGDMAKLVLIYTVSFGFVITGLCKLRKERGNHFYLAVTGCGMGAVYLSLFLTNAYFGMIGELTLYLLLLVWAGGNCILAKYHSRIFQVIGQCGVTIAVIFGCALCVKLDSIEKLVVLSVFYVVAANVFYWISFARELSGNYVHHIFHGIDLSALCIVSAEIIEDGSQPHLLSLAFLVLLVFHIGVVFWNRWKAESVGYGLILTMYTILFGFFSVQLFENDGVHGVFIYVAAMAVSILAEIKIVLMRQRVAAMGEGQASGAFTTLVAHRESCEGKSFLQVVMMMISAIGLAQMQMPEGLFWIFSILPVLVLGFVYDNPVYKYGAVIQAVFYLILSVRGGDVLTLLCQIFVLALAVGLLFYKKEQYTLGYKNWLYLTIQFFIAREFAQFLTSIFASEELVTTIVYAILLGCNLMMRFRLAKNRKTGEAENVGLYNVINLLLMLLGVHYIVSFEVEALHILVILLTLVAFLVNGKNLLQSHKSMAAGIYVGIKFTFLMLVILTSFDVVNYAVSVCCFLFAIMSVTAGFLMKYKSLRIYGIVLSMLSIFKLLMLDINYDNTLGNALSFFISGMLCFAISMIYNYVDKKLLGAGEMSD